MTISGDFSRGLLAAALVALSVGAAGCAGVKTGANGSGSGAGSGAGETAMTGSEGMDGETPVWMTCPDEIGLPAREGSDEDTNSLRAVRPSAGGEENADLHAVVQFLPGVYVMYDAFDADEDPVSAFPSDQLTLNALIIGNPGRATERGLRAKRNRTFYGYWATNPATNEDVIVIRGTITPREWIRNIQATQRDLPKADNGARVHKGFQEIYKTFELDRGPYEGDFLDAVDAGAFSDRPVVITGHSLGGALAVLTATDIARFDDKAETRLITVASPRVGNEAFRDVAGAIGSAVRICNMPDLVPMVPPSGNRITYVHVGEPALYSSFDYDSTLINETESKGDQILCWHGIDTYTWMLDHDHEWTYAPQCWR